MKVAESVRSVLCGCAVLLSAALPAREIEPIPITNVDGVTIEAEVLSVVRNEKNDSWLCFRIPDGEDLFLYPFSRISRTSLDLLSATFAGESGQLLVADGLTGHQIDLLEEYLAAGPREQLLIELREARRIERLLSREWKRLQDQTWQIQQQLAGIKDPDQKIRVTQLFQTSLAARDRTGKQLVLLQAKIRRIEERIDLLRRIGAPLEGVQVIVEP